MSSRPDCIFEIHQLWQSGFSKVYSNSYCSYKFAPKQEKIGQSSHKEYSNQGRIQDSPLGGAQFKKKCKLFLLEAVVGGPGAEPPAAGGKG